MSLGFKDCRTVIHVVDCQDIGNSLFIQVYTWYQPWILLLTLTICAFQLSIVS